MSSSEESEPEKTKEIHSFSTGYDNPSSDPLASSTLSAHGQSPIPIEHSIDENEQDDKTKDKPKSEIEAASNVGIKYETMDTTIEKKVPPRKKSGSVFRQTKAIVSWTERHLSKQTK